MRKTVLVLTVLLAAAALPGIGARALFNQFLPYFQGHAGYSFSHETDGDNIHAVNVGVYAGLW